MPKRTGIHKKHLLQPVAFTLLFAVLVWLTLITSVNTLIASPSSPLQSNVTTVTPQQQSPVPPQDQRVFSPPQPPQISWDELEDASDFVANGKIDSIIYTIYGKWLATGDWAMDVVDGELRFFNTTMVWNNGTAGHSHEFLNFEPTEDVDISADDQIISVAGTMDIGTNGVISWQDIPAEILIEAGRIVTVSLNDEDTNRHFGGQSVHGNVTSLNICSNTPGPAMEIPLAC